MKNDTYTCIHVYLYIHLYVEMHACMYVCVCIHVCVCVYVYTHIHMNPKRSTLYYAIMPPVRKSGFRSEFRADSNRKDKAGSWGAGGGDSTNIHICEHECMYSCMHVCVNTYCMYLFARMSVCACM